jgi:hypothetical protein
MVPLLDPLGIARFWDGFRLALLWLPISCVYCAVIIAALRMLRLDHIRSLFFGLGFVVAFFPTVSGVWPTYWATARGAVVLIPIQLTLLTLVTFVWSLSVRLFTKMGLTNLSS